MLNLLILFNKCAENIVQMSGVYKNKFHSPGKLSFHLYLVAFSILAWTVVFLILFSLTDLFSLNLCTLFDVNVIYLAGTPFVKEDPFGKRASRRVHFDISEESSSPSEETSGLNFTTLPTAAAAANEVQDKMDAAWQRACMEVKESLQKCPKGSKPLGEYKTACRIRVRYNQLMNLEPVRTTREILDIESHVRKVKLNFEEATKLDLERKSTRFFESQLKLIQDKYHLNVKLQAEAREHRLQQAAEAREHRLQQAAEAGAVRRFNLRSYLSKENTVRHYFVGATKRSRASMHPKAKWPYDASNNYVVYKGPTRLLNVVDNDISPKTKVSFNDMEEKEDPFIHKSSPPGDEPPSDEGSPNIPEDGDETSLVKKLIGFVSHLVPYWIDINSPQAKFLLFLFFTISFILIIFGTRYLYYRFIKPLFNKNSKDSNTLKDKKDTKL